MVTERKETQLLAISVFGLKVKPSLGDIRIRPNFF